MMLLIAEGKDSRERGEWIIEPHRAYRLGRASEADISVPWEPYLSRQHATVKLDQDRLIVEIAKNVPNFAYYQGSSVPKCELVGGEFFVIGHTSFRWKPTPESKPSTFMKPADELTFSREALQRVHFRDPDQRIEVLSRLPEVIWGARTDEELHLRLVNLLLAGIPQADAAALLSYQNDEIRLLHWDRRRETAGELRPSTRLIRDALVEKRQSVLHFWNSASPLGTEYTTVNDLDWAFCTPVRGSATSGWGLYLAGQTPQGGGSHGEEHRDRLQSDVKFAELVAEIVSSVRRLSQLERRQSGLRQFFPPTVLSAVGEDFDLNLCSRARRTSRSCSATCEVSANARKRDGMIFSGYWIE
ncbi:MAG: FHA domain-containing protein [Planctomycetales bacterium]